MAGKEALFDTHVCVQNTVQTKSPSALTTAQKSLENGNEDDDEGHDEQGRDEGRGARTSSTSRIASIDQPERQVSGSKREAAKEAALQSSGGVSTGCSCRRISASVLLVIY